MQKVSLNIPFPYRLPIIPNKKCSFTFLLCALLGNIGNNYIRLPHETIDMFSNIIKNYFINFIFSFLSAHELLPSCNGSVVSATKEVEEEDT